jgi:hypothetical protein
MRVRVALAYAWGCSPSALRDVTLAEAAEMVAFLDRVAAARRRE